MSSIFEVSETDPEGTLRPATADEEALIAETREQAQAMDVAEAYAQRDALLAATDYTQLPDVPPEALGTHEDGTPVTVEEWQAYRQDLRDLPETAGGVFTREAVTWPEPPSQAPFD